MPVIAIIDGQRFAVHADHLNTPRRLTDASNRPRWQWAYSAFGDVPAQSLPIAGVPTVSYSLRYPGQVDDGDPIGLEGGWNRFGYAEANPLEYIDPFGLRASPGDNSIYPPTHNCSCVINCVKTIEVSEIPSTFCSELYKKLSKGGIVSSLMGTALGELCVGFWKESTCRTQCTDCCSGKSDCCPY